jgi:hypothetical protein
VGFNPSAFDEDAFDPDAFEFGAAVNTAPAFDGPNIGNLSGVVNVPFVPVDYSGRFSDADMDELTFAIVGTLPAGLSLSTAGVLSGTPTETGTFADLVVQATDGTDTDDSNAFTVTIQAANPGAGGAGRRSGTSLALRIGL